MFAYIVQFVAIVWESNVGWATAESSGQRNATTTVTVSSKAGAPFVSKNLFRVGCELKTNLFDKVQPNRCH